MTGELLVAIVVAGVVTSLLADRDHTERLLAIVDRRGV